MPLADRPVIERPAGAAGGRPRQAPAGVAMTAALVVLALAGLPLAAWLDLRNVTEAAMRGQADALDTAINAMRDYYATNIVGRSCGPPPRPRRSSTATATCRAPSPSRRLWRSSSAT